ncbi:hypothetical protein KAFR_0A05910 [Kazachstania africana CBS 2517]|uniref:Cytochrome c oxidase subunit 8, mitochondrial n=1 Tax=Kazachstania africana (strain ATCC 22294 / BCRC 22015 / CBS 2517 / CECT 1963 / NBRC 1671 / NRRL Y-8276) TaxID=1071382 RepID=H2ANS6_KAZAF|nr:hypothetical protein KAFR_0A05910 [Kazachstania africana CBS 2517]CCF56026.1 hypothetical protein KAFR_0A05910 [Kazachstania africana CBS 2517]
MIEKSLQRLAFKRAFTTTPIRSVHFAEGVYSNLPFKVLNRKIPYGVIHFGFFGLGFAVPFLIGFVQMKKSGNI